MRCAWRSPATLQAVLEGFRVALGLPARSHLRAELHALLVYGKGQFFLPHQDSEKDDEMVATLVVALPSIHTGGALVVDDGGQQRTYRGSRDELVLVAFYADRRHEVNAVRSGYSTQSGGIPQPRPSNATAVGQTPRHTAALRPP